MVRTLTHFLQSEAIALSDAVETLFLGLGHDVAPEAAATLHEAVFSMKEMSRYYLPEMISA
jgi:hypothetical protein